MDKSLLLNHMDQPRSMIKEQSCKANEPPYRFFGGIF